MVTTDPIYYTSSQMKLTENISNPIDAKAGGQTAFFHWSLRAVFCEERRA